jgi:hypothetical protein
MNFAVNGITYATTSGNPFRNRQPDELGDGALLALGAECEASPNGLKLDTPGTRHRLEKG